MKPTIGSRVTIGIVPRERWSLSVRSLRSVLEHSPPDVDLVCVDGGSPDAISDELRRLVAAHDGRFIRVDHVLSCNEARNMIVDASDGREFIAFVENDVLVRPGWLDALVVAADETDAGAVQPLVLMGSDDDAHLVHIGYGNVEIHDGVMDTNVHEHEWDHIDHIPEQTRQPTGQMEFHTFLARRAMLDEVGPFDEHIRSIGDHEDLVLNAQRAGWPLYYEPSSVVVFLQFIPLTVEDRGFWQLHWSEEWIENSLDYTAEKWGVRRDTGWPEEARRWSSQRRTWWFHGSAPPLALLGKVFRRAIFHPTTSRVARVVEERLFGGPGRAERDRRAAARAAADLPTT